MALHISGKLCAVGLVLATLITAFSAPPKPEYMVNLVFQPQVILLEKSQTQATSAVPLTGPVATATLSLKATGYNSQESQTDSTPHITATGTTTRFGIIAVSRDLLATDIPYGSLVRIKDLGSFYNGRGAGRYQEMLDGQGLFIVEDTMHQRKRGQVDVWFPHLSEAINWGVRQVEVEVIRYGWSAPEFYAAAPSSFEGEPRLAAVW